MIIELYRGLMDILITQNLELENRLIDHVRPFHEVKPLEPGDSGFFNGYWNFMLEIVMVLFAKFIFVMGILLITCLAIVFFPLDFVSRVATFGGRDGRIPNQSEIEYNEPKMEQEKK